MATGLTFYVNGQSVYCQYYASDGRVQMSVGLKVDKDKFRDGVLTKEQRAHTRRLQTVVDRYEADTRLSGRATLREDVAVLILEAIGKRAKAKGGTVLTYFSRYLEEVRGGRILNGGKQYGDAYLRTARSVLALLKKTALASVPAERVTSDHVRAFAAELTKMERGKGRKYAKNTVAVYSEFIRQFLSEGARMGWYKMDTITGAGVSAEKVNHAVYINDAEMRLIGALAYSGEKAVWRDAFLLGCMLGMRYSDLIRLTPAHRTGNVVNINTQKTGAAVWVPMSSWARELWDRYYGKFSLPRTADFIEFVKDAGKDAGLDKGIHFSRTEGGKKVERWVKKWELLGTHTMRRSFATNAYKAGVPILSIMKVTGHKTTESFMRYIRLGDEEHAATLLEHSHFQ